MSYDALGSSREDKIWTYLLLGSGGVLVMTLGPLLARWLADVPFVPFSEPLRWIGGFNDPWEWAARVAIGLLGGLVLAFLTLVDEWRLEVHDDAVLVIHDEDRRRLSRDTIVGVHLDGRKVVIDGTEGRRLLEKRVEAKRERISEAFRSRGYPFENE